MTTYKPKTDAQRRRQIYEADILADLAHAEACLRERDVEIAALKRSLLKYGRVVTQCPRCYGVGGCHSSCTQGG